MTACMAILFACLLAPQLNAGSATCAQIYTLFETGKYEEAALSLRASLERPEGRAAECYHWLSRSYYELKNYGNAIAYGLESVRLEPNNSEYHYWLGKAYGRKAETGGFNPLAIHERLANARKARDEFERAVSLDPKHIAARRDLIEFYLEAPEFLGGSRQGALSHIEELAKYDAVEARVARILFWSRDPDSSPAERLKKAEAECELILKLKPDRTKPYFEVAGFYEKRKNAVRMEEAVEAAAMVDPHDPLLAYYRGVARIIAGTRLEEAKRLLTLYMETVPEKSDYPSREDTRKWLHQLQDKTK